MQLQIPICSFDAKTGILCSMCEARLRNGQIREADVQASKALLQLAGRLRGAASLVRSFKVDGNYVLELDQSGLVVFKDNPEGLEGLEKLLGGHVWLARASSSDREFIEDLLYPVKVLALGTIWLPDGTKIAKATVAGRTSRRTHPSELIKRIVKEVRGIDVVVESDDENRPRETALHRNILPGIVRLMTTMVLVHTLPIGRSTHPSRPARSQQSHRRCPSGMRMAKKTIRQRPPPNLGINRLKWMR